MTDDQATNDRPMPPGGSGPGSLLFVTASFVLAAVVLTVRVWFEFGHIDQPIFEGYVGRQVPTAMVARGLIREGAFLYPSLQTGPFPSWFLIEAPTYAQAVAWGAQATGFPLDRCGRLVSLIALVLATMGCAAMTRRLYGGMAALWAAIFMLSWPVTIRYGRSFQPDTFALALFMLGAVSRMRADDEVARDRENDIYPTLAWFALALAFASKVTLAPLLIGLAWPNLPGRPRHTNVRFLASTLLPAMAWYGWAGWLQLGANGQAAGYSRDAFAFWTSAPGPLSLLSLANLQAIALNVGVRSWTPVGLLLLVPVVLLWRSDPAARRWALALGCWFLLVGGKAHHGYYWLVPTPFLAMFGGCFMARLDAGRRESTRLMRVTARQLGFAAGVLMIALSLVMALDTYGTPPDWSPLGQDLSRFRAWTFSTPGRAVVAPEAAIYVLDRPGFRWEWSPAGQRRAASAFGKELAGEPPGALLRFYMEQNAAWFLALETDPGWKRHGADLEAILGKMRIVHRSGGLVLYELTETMATNERR